MSRNLRASRTQYKKANVGTPPRAGPSRGLCRNRDKLSIYLASLVSVDQNLKPPLDYIFSMEKVITACGLKA